MTKPLGIKQPNFPSSERTRRAIEKIHSDRFSTLKRAMTYSVSGNYAKAIEEYKNFLKILSAYHDCRENEITPSIFQKDKELTEIFLLSQVYWDLSRIYDKDPRYLNQMKSSLEKFLDFTKGNKFQYANSQVVIKYIKSGMCRHQEEFRNIHRILNKNGGPCFISTFCYGENHPITNDLRLFKHQILGYSWGKKLVPLYYRYSPKLLNFCRKHPFLGISLKVLIFYPILFLTYLFWDKKFLRWHF
jgi:hypothetical protein